MSVIGSNVLAGASGSAGAAAGYEIERSLRFNDGDSPYLSKTFGSGTRKKWTWSTWLKRTSTNKFEIVFGASGAPNVWIAFGGTTAGSAGDRLAVRLTDGSTNNYIYTDAVLRDPSAWYHVVVNIDTDNGTEADRIKFYINGVLQTRNGTVTSGLNPTLNSNIAHSIGRNANSGDHFDGYLAENHFVDGTALAATDFGEYDTNNVWQPIEYSGTYGTNGFYLNFSDNSSNAALGTDSSGNGNTFTVNSLSVASGAGNDSLIDTPMNYTPNSGNAGGNYCTWNPLAKSNDHTLSNGNLDSSFSNATPTSTTVGTIGMTSGKFYWESTLTAQTGSNSGVAGLSAVSSGMARPGNDANTWIYNSTNGNIYHNGSNTSYGDSYAVGDVIGTAFDADNGNLYFYKNGVVQNSGTAAATGLTSGPYFPAIGDISASNTFTASTNFGQRPFAYTPPTGYLSLCTQNLADPTIADGSTAFDAVKIDNASTTGSITGLSFAPDFAWFKSRGDAGNHFLLDIIRDDGILRSNLTNAEVTGTDYIDWNSDGVGYKNGLVDSGSSNIVWLWDGGTSTETNNDGNVTASVRANASAGQSIVSVDSIDSTNTIRTAGHGLNATPHFIISKNRDFSDHWFCYHKDVQTNNRQQLRLNTTDATVTSGSDLWAHTSSVIGFNGALYVASGNTDNLIFYCFAPVAGFSAFGSYAGNGSTDGPFVFTGFRPRWVMVKSSSNSGEHWLILDTERDSYNLSDATIYANLDNAEAEASALGIDILSNGFKARGTNAGANASGYTYVWAAFASHPFKTARAR